MIAGERGEPLRRFARVLVCGTIAALLLASSFGQDRSTSPAPAEEKVHLRLIQLARKAGETDEQIRARANHTIIAPLKAGAAFADLARQHSSDRRRAAGGDWGWVARTELRPPIAGVVFALKKGEASAPFVQDGDCFVLFVEDRR